MAVTIDHISSGSVSPAGTNLSFWNTNTVANSTQDGTSFMTISVGATGLLVGAQIFTDPAAQGTNSFIWDQGGTNQTMTALGPQFFNVDSGAQLQLFGLVNPTSGTKTLRLSNAGNTNGNQSAVIFGISFNGNDTTSVAAAFQAYATNQNASGTPSATASVSSAASVASGDKAVAFYYTDTGGGATFPTDGGTFGDMAFGNSREYESYSGAGATINSSFATTVSQFWSVLIVGIKAPGAAPPTVSAPLGILGFVEIEW